MTKKYFTNDTFTFLKELENNNNRPWFNENKQRYEDLVRTPSLQFIEDMGDALPSLTSRFRAIPKKTGGSLRRVYRDIRFAKNKTPYKINIGIHFRHEAAVDVHAPGFYLNISNEQSFVGAGIWRPGGSTLRKIRDCLDENSRTWLATKNDAEFKKVFKLRGESLTNGPRGFPKDHPLIEDLKRKEFIAFHDLKKTTVTSSDLLEKTIEHYSKVTPFMRYLCYAVELPFD